jgi:hypothetical protein
MSRLLEFRASNYMRISCVRIRPDGAVVKIVGKNDQGKTSVLSGIWTLFVGKAAAPPMLIREGAEECKLYGELEGMKISRIFTKTESGDVTMSLDVTDESGAKVRKKPQAMLDAMIGAYSFDPLAFAEAEPKKQFDTLKALVAGFDFDANAAQRQKAFETRTDINRRAKEARTLAERIVLPAGPCPKAVDVGGKLTELEEANRHNAGIFPEQQRRERLQTTATQWRQAAADRRLQAEKLCAQADEDEARATAEEAKLAALPPLPAEKDTAAIREEIGAAERIKGIRTLHENRRRHEDDAESLGGEATALTTYIEKLDQEKMDAIAAAKMPVDGLGFGDNEILLHGIPFSQAATSIKIRTSVAIGIALNPELRIMTLDEASELDSGGLKMLAEMAEAADFQIWCTRVDESAQSGFVMVDGHLAEGA